MADYILFSPNADRINEKTIYRFFTKEQYLRRFYKGKEFSIDSYVEKQVENKKNEDIKQDKKDKIIDFIIRSGNNYKKSKDYELEKEDIFLSSEDLYPIKDYEEFKSVLIREKNKNPFLRKKYNKIIGSIKSDQLRCKEIILKPIEFKDILPDTTVYDYNKFDFFDEEHVSELLKIKSKNIMTDLGLLVNYIDSLLEKSFLTKQEKQILKFLRKLDMTQVEISKQIGVSPQYVDKLINKIVKKIIDKHYDIYEDWYYLNIVKGDYKKCSMCGEIKIANERHFSPDNYRGGFMRYCKKCRSGIKKG